MTTPPRGLILPLLAILLLICPKVFSADCNGNGIEDALDIGNLGAAQGQDSCAGAEQAGPGFIYSGNTDDATNDGSAPCASSGASPDMWYQYTPSASGPATVALCGSAYDSALSIHTGCPGTAANLIACDDDSCGNLTSSATFLVAAGQSYLIRVSGFSNNAGVYQMQITGPESVYPLSNDANGNSIPDECETEFRAEPNRLNFNLFFDDAPASKTVTLSDTLTTPSTFLVTENASWLEVSPSSGGLGALATSQTLVLTVNPTIGIGSYTENVRVARVEAPMDELLLPVRFNVNDRPPVIALNTNFLASQVFEGTSPPDGSFTVQNVGGGIAALDYQILTQFDWITVNPATGSSTGEADTIEVEYAMNDFEPGNYSNTIGVINNSTGQFERVFVFVTIYPDCNANSVIDSADIASGTSGDCNGNGVPDECDIARGTSQDANANGLPDECDPEQCAPLPFYDGFESGSFAAHWLRRGTNDSRIEAAPSGGDFAASLDDRAPVPVPLFESGFGAGSENLFTVRAGSVSGSEDFTANFQYDYSTYAGPTPGSGNFRPASIPLAPRTAPGGDTTALRLEVNQADTIPEMAGVSVFPIVPGHAKLDRFVLVFDLFANFCGTGFSNGATASGTGTTQHIGAGLAADSTAPMWPAALGSPGFRQMTGWFWAMTIDGGSSADYDYWEASADDESAGAPLRFSSAPDWWGNGPANLPNNTTPWLNFFTGGAYEEGGSPAKAWVTVEIFYADGVATLYMTPAVGAFAGARTLVAQWTPNVSSGADLEKFPEEGVPFVTLFDTFNSIARFPQDEFALIDNFAVFADQGNSIPSRSELTLCLDLAGQTGVNVEFDARVAGADLAAPAADPFLNGADFDGLAVSDNLGRTWYEAQALRTPGAAFNHFTLNLDQVASSHGLTPGSDFRLRFNEFGNEINPDGGLMIDNVRITSDAVTAPAIELAGSNIPVEWTVGAPAPGPRVFTVRNSGGGTLQYAASSSSMLAAPLPEDGSSIGETDTISVSFNLAGQAPGIYQAVITVSDPSSSNGSATMTFQITIHPPEVMGIF